MHTKNGVEFTDMSVILNEDATLNLRKLALLNQANTAGTDGLLRNGIIGSLHGYNVRESVAPAPVTAGTGTNYVINGSHAIGATSIVVKTGSGTILAGDAITINGVKYVVKTGVAAAGTLVINEPGLLAAASDSDTVSVGAAATANIALQRGGVCAVVRPALQPMGGASESHVITDPVTGFSFLMTKAVGKLMTSYYMNVVYDSFAANPFCIHQLLG